MTRSVFFLSLFLAVGGCTANVSSTPPQPTPYVIPKDMAVAADMARPKDMAVLPKDMAVVDLAAKDDDHDCDD